MELVKKYHPDKYQGNPLADLAQEKLQEVNEAYDLLMKSSGAGNGASPYGAQPFSGGYAGGSAYGSGQAGYGSGNYGSYSSSSPVYNQIRSCINRGDIGAAERLLQSIPERSQEAEWLFQRSESHGAGSVQCRIPGRLQPDAECGKYVPGVFRRPGLFLHGRRRSHRPAVLHDPSLPLLLTEEK